MIRIAEVKQVKYKCKMDTFIPTTFKKLFVFLIKELSILFSLTLIVVSENV